MKSIVIVPILFASVGAFASDWHAVSVGSQVTAYVDRESIRFQANTAKVWVKWEYESDQELENAYPAATFRVVKSLELYKCVERTTSTIQSVYYSDPEQGDVVRSLSLSEKQWAWSEVVPDTMGETILGYVCRAKPKHKAAPTPAPKPKK